MSNSSLVDIIIVSYYTGDILFECIKSVLQLINLNKIFIINNGNPLETENKLIELGEVHKNIFYIAGHGNIGFSKACNMGAKLAQAEFILFLNPDCVIADFLLLQKLTEALKGNKYQVATCKILNSDGTIQKTCRRNLLTPMVALSESFDLYKFSNKFQSLNRPILEIDGLDAVSQVAALSGAVIFTTTKYYQDIGGLDEQYFLHVEDMDFCMKVHRLGDKIAFVKDAVVMHMLSTSSNTSNRFLEYHKARGFMLYLQKFFPIFNYFPFDQILKFNIYLRYLLKIFFK